MVHLLPTGKTRRKDDFDYFTVGKFKKEKKKERESQLPAAPLTGLLGGPSDPRPQRPKDSEFCPAVCHSHGEGGERMNEVAAALRSCLQPLTRFVAEK